MSAVRNVGARRGNPQVAVEGDELSGGQRRPAGVLGDRVAVRLQRVEDVEVEAAGVVDRPARVGDGDDDRAPLGEEAGGVPADGPVALDGHARAGEVDAGDLLDHLGGDRDAEPGGAELVERDPAEHGRQADGTPHLVVELGDVRLGQPHVGTGHVLDEVTDRAPEGPHDPLLVAGGQVRVGDDPGLRAAVGQAGRGVLERHGPREPGHLLDRHVRGHPHAADRGPGGDVVDDHTGLEAGARVVEVDDLRRSQLVARHLPLEAHGRPRPRSAPATAADGCHVDRAPGSVGALRGDGPAAGRPFDAAGPRARTDAGDVKARAGWRRGRWAARLAAAALVPAVVVGCADAGTIADPPSVEEPPPVSALASPTTIRLPRPDTTGRDTAGTDRSLEAVLAARRSAREFADRPLGEREIALLLWAAQGVTGSAGQRTAPSAGGLYPLEVYVVDASGVGHYRPANHVLEHRAGTGLRAALAHVALDQAHVRDAPVVLVIAAVSARSEAKYGDRGERYAILEAGHAAQNVLLQATALGLGAVPVGAFDDAAVQRVLDLPADHAPLELIPVGPTA